MNAATLINQDSGDTEYFSPMEIVDAARRAMGYEIRLDPASSNVANAKIGALRYYGKELDGLKQEWCADSVWLNHPFSREGNPLWINKIETEFESGRAKQACCITFAATSEKWFRPLLKRPQCFLHGRTNYYLPSGEIKRGVTKGSVVTYYGPNVDRFAEEFSKLGTIKIPYETKRV